MSIIQPTIQKSNRKRTNKQTHKQTNNQTNKQNKSGEDWTVRAGAQSAKHLWRCHRFGFRFRCRSWGWWFHSWTTFETTKAWPYCNPGFKCYPNESLHISMGDFESDQSTWVPKFLWVILITDSKLPGEKTIKCDEMGWTTSESFLQPCLHQEYMERCTYTGAWECLGQMVSWEGSQSRAGVATGEGSARAWCDSRICVWSIEAEGDELGWTKAIL